MSLKRFSRRSMLRGTLAGGAVAVGLPLLDFFLDDHGTALAQGGSLPLRFGSWFWGCGMTPSRWVPTSVGTGYALPPELVALDRRLADGSKLRDQVTVLSGFDVELDGRPNIPHESGLIATLTGLAPREENGTEYVPPTLDAVIASEIGTETRFRSLETSCTGVSVFAYSKQENSVPNVPEVSPLALYSRVFGPEFVDPSDGDFVPDPTLLLRQSVLSAVKEDRDRLMALAGSHDRQRLDQYFTAVRQLETQLDVLLAGPPDLASCVRPPTPTGENVGAELEQSRLTNRMMGELLALALACDQTRVFSQMFSYQRSFLRLPGAATGHHQLTHDEAVDPVLGYQPQTTEFTLASMEAFADFIERLAGVPEGDGTLLDNTVVFAHSDVSFAKDHLVQGIPMFVAGRGGGALQPGQHIAGNGTLTTRVPLTIQQVLGIETGKFGVGAMEADAMVSELLA